MVNYSPTQLDAAFSALADPVRREIIARLLQGPATVTEVAEPFPISLPAISRHVRVLEGAGLLVRRRQGRFHHLHLNAEPLKEAADWLGIYEDFWEHQFDALEKFLAEQPKDGNA
ncbi:MAG: winged helix-turn-helix transcriptional regulator [Chloroflexi bacterium]|nr:winged helix-turn-helix transcriptional regulator [Chloroflexota bacterium]